MRVRWALAITSSCALLSACSLLTPWDGLTDAGFGSAAGGAGATVDGGACVPGMHYCGGHEVSGDSQSLYLCTGDGSAMDLGVCPYNEGCVVQLNGMEDICGCFPEGKYCGGDKVLGDPNTLYRCVSDNTGTPIMTCDAGCTRVPGNDDACK